MNTVQLFQRIGRKARGGDFTKLSMAEANDVIEAANTAIQQAYSALPAYFREITEGFVLPAPLPITFPITQFAQTLSSDVFTNDQIGQSIVISGDPAWNQILGPNQLLNPYMGATNPAVTATIYGDAIYSRRYPFERIIANPRFANQTQVPFYRSEISPGNSGRANWLYMQQVGMPLSWWTQPLGNSQGNNPLLVLRFSPAPDQAYSINVRMSYWPRRLLYSDYQSASDVTMPDQFIETVLMPLALRALMATPVWIKGDDDADVVIRAAAAEEHAKNQLGQVASPSNRVFTPIGF
jgi:hypothetical protein